MEPEDLPWPGELEEEEEEEEAAAAAKATNSDAAEAVGEVGEEAGKLDSDFNYGYHHLESTDDDDEDEEAKAWLQAHPGGPLPPPSPSAKYGYSEGEQPSPGKVVPLNCYVWQQSFHQGSSRTQITNTNAPETTAQWGSGDDQRIESWHCLPQEMDSSLTLATPQTEFSATAEGTEVTDFPSVEEGVLTQSENQVKAPTRNLLCSPLLVIQDSFASPDLPLLTCPSQDQEFGSDSLFHQSELGFAPLRGIPDRSEDTEWLSRPSEVSEALFQATSEVTSDLSNSCFSVSQHTLRGSTAVGSQRSLQGNNEEAISSGTVDELKTPNVSDSYGAPSSYMSWKTQKDTQQPEINLTDKDEVSISTSSDITDGNIDTKRSSNFDASCSHSQYWTQGVLQPEETYLISKDHDSFFDSCETIDKSKIPQESNNFSVPFTCVPWNNEGTPHHPETCVISKDCASFPHEVAPHDDKMSFSFLRRLFGRRGKGVPLTSDSVCLRAPAENEVQQQMDSLGDYEKDEDDLLEELSQYFEQTQTKNNLISSEVQPRSAQKQYIGNVVVPDNTVKVAEAHILSRGRDTSKMEPSAGLHQTVKSHLDETSEQLYFQEEGKQRATSVFGEKNVDATENVAFEAVIASIEPSKKESTVNEIQTDINKSLTDDSQEREPKYSDFSPLNYNDENSFFDELKHPRYQSTPGVFEPETSKPLLHKKDDDDSSLYQHPNLKSPPYTPQEMFSKPLPVITELKSSAALSEKSYNQAVGLGKTQSALFQYDINNEPFLPVGKIKSVPALGLAEKVGSSDINYYMKVSTSDSLVLQDLKQPTFEEVADSSNYNLGKDVNSSNAIEGPPTAVGSSFSANLVAYGAESQGALPLTSDASIAFGQETLLKADIGQGEIPRLVGAVSHFTIHTIMQNDSYFVEGLQGKTESDVITPAAAAERYSLYENVVGGERAEVPRKAGLSNLRVNRPFPSFVPHEPTRGSEYHSSTLRMLRVSPDALPKTLQHLTGDTTKGGIAEITQSNLKSGITTTPGDSDTLSHLSLSPEDLSQSAVSSPQDNTIGQHTDTLKQKTLADTHLTEETLKVSAIPEPTDQKTRTPTVPSSSYSHRGKPNIFYRQGLPDSHLTEEALKVLGVPGPADQKTGIPTITSTSHSHRGKPVIFYQQGLTGSPIPEEALKVSAVSGPADQKTRIAPVPSTPYSHRERPGTFYQQELLDIKQTEEAPKICLGVEGTGAVRVFWSAGQNCKKLSIDSHLPKEDQKVLAAPGPADHKTGIPPTVISTSYSDREKPGIFYQQALAGSHIPEEALRVSFVPGPVDQTTGIATVTSTSKSQHREKPGVFYQQDLPGSHLAEEAQKVLVVSGPADQTSGIPTVTSTSYSHREKPGIFYQQVLPGSHIPKETLRVPFAPSPADQKTGRPTVTSASNLHREKPIIFYQEALPDTHLPEKAQKVSPSLGSADQKTDIPTAASPSYSPIEKPIIFYQQTLSDSHPTEEAQKVSFVSGPADQKTGIPTVTSTPYPQREKLGIFYQQGLPGSHLTEEALKVSAVPESTDQKTGTPTVSPTSYSLGDKSIIFYPQVLPDSHLTEEALKVSVVSGPADQKTGIPTVSPVSYSLGEKPIIFYQQTLSDSQLSKESLKVLGVAGPVDQKTGIPPVTYSSYSQREKPIISYQQELPDSLLTKKALKVSNVPEPAGQKTGIPTVTSTSYSHRERPGVSYQQDLPEFDEEALILSGIASGVDQRNVIRIVPSGSYSHNGKPIISYQQELPNYTEEALKVLVVPGTADQKTGIQIVPSTSYSQGEQSIIYQQELPDLTEVALKSFGVSGPADQKTEIQKASSSSYSHREKPSIYPQQEFPDSHLTDEALKASAVFVPAEQDTGIPTGIPNYYSPQEKLKISAVNALDVQKTELPTTTPSSYSYEETPRISTVIGPDDQKTPLLTVFRSPYSQRVKPAILLQQQLPDGDQSESILKISTVPEPTDVKPVPLPAGKPVPLSSSSFQREKPTIFYPQELPDTHLTEDTLKLSTVPGSADQKTVLPVVSPSSFSLREKSNIFYQKDLPDRHVTEDALKFSGGPGQADQITGLQTVPSDAYSDGEKHKLVSKHVQRQINNLNSSDSSVSSNNMPLNSQADGKVVINKPESAGLVDVGSEEIRDAENSSKTLKEIQTLLMEAENIALKRCNFPAPLVPFRDVGDISFVQSKKVVCFKEPSMTDVCNGDLLQRQPYTEESPNNRCMQKDIGTQTNLKCQKGIENWEFISATTVRSPLQEAECKASMALEETLRKYEAAKSVMRSEPEGYNRTIGNKIIIPMMTIIKSDSSSDISDGNGSYSWDSNLPESLESVSDVLLNFFPYVTPKTSITDSREEEGMSESEDGGGSSIDSLAGHVKNLLKCESSLNHAKQILRNAEEEECRVRARAWNMKFNLAHDYGYSISELNEDDRRKVEEIKSKLFGHGRTTDLSKDLQSPRGIGCKPEAVCSHIIIESHEKGCFRTLTAAEQSQLDSHTCVFRSSDPSEMIRGRRSPSSWKDGHINLSTSLDQNNPHLKVWNSVQLQSHSPFQEFVSDDFKISKGLRMPFHEKMNAFVPPKEVDFHSSSQMPPPEPTKKFTTSITFSSHRHSKCISDSSMLKVGVSEGSQCTGASVGVFNSHFTEEQNPPRDLSQKTSSPSSFKTHSHSSDKDVTILAEGSRKSQKLPVNFKHSHKEEKCLERSDFKGSHSEPSASANCSNFKEVQFSDNHTLISMGRPSSTLGVKQKNVTITPDIPSSIFLEQRELFEQSRAPHADHHVRKQHSPPQCQDYVGASFLSPIFLEQRQSKAPCIDNYMKKHHFPFPQGQDSVVEKNDQHKPKSHASNMISVEAKFSNVSQSPPDYCTLETSASTPPSNRKALSCVRITLCPKTPSKLDSGTLDKRFHSLDAASKTRMNSEFNFDLQPISSRSLEPTSKLLTSKPIAQDQECLGFLGHKSTLDFQVVQSSLPDSNTVTQDLKTIPSQNRQIVTSRQTQVNISDLEGYSNPEGTPISADRSSQKIKTPCSAFPGKLSSDAVTQITTESPEKAIFSSQIFINAEDRGREIPESSSQKLNKAPIKFASSSAVQHLTFPRGTDGQPLLLPYKPSGSTKMYYVPQLGKIPPSMDSTSDTTIESSHSGSNDAIAPDFPAQVLGTRDDDLSATVNIKHKEGIYSKRATSKAFLPVGKKPLQKDNADASVQVAIIGDEDLSNKKQKEEIISTSEVTKVAQPEEKESLQKDTADSSDVTAAEHSAQVQDTKIKDLPDTKAIKQKEKIHSKTTVPMQAWPEDEKSLQIDIEEAECRSEFENTTHSVFRSAKFYIHHPVHPPSDQDGQESLGRSVFVRHSWKDFFQHHPGKHREHARLPSFENADKTKTDHARIKSLSINVNLANKEVVHTPKSQGKDHPQHNRQISDPKKDHKVTPELKTPHTVCLNELWNKYKERQRQQKPSELSDKKELSLVERLDRLAKILQNPITYSLQASESTQDDSRGERGAKEWSSRQQQRHKLLKKKRYKSLEKSRKNTGDLKKNKVLSTHQAGRSNQIKIEQIKFDKYILRKQPNFNYISNTSSDSRPSEESELLTDTPTNILSTTSVESDVLTQTDGEVALHERSSSISTIDTARLIQAFGHDRVCLSPRRIKLYSSVTNQQRRYLERRSKHNIKALNTGHPLMTSEHTRRHIQVAKRVISSDSISSSANSFLSSNSTMCNKQNVRMLNKAIQAGNLEIVNGTKKHTRDVGLTFPTPSSSKARLEEDSDMTSWSEEKIEEKVLFTSYPEDKKLKKNKQISYEGVSWFVPVENMKSGSKKENVPEIFGPGISWFEPITKTKPWREPLREQNWQGQRMDCPESLADPGKEPPKPFVRATLQEALQLHRPDFISRSGERIKRLKLIVQERKLQNILQNEREELFNSERLWPGSRNPVHRLPKRVFLAVQKNRPIGRKEMIQRSKRIYEQLPEVRKRREEEKRRSEYKSYRLRAQLYKTKVTNQLLGRKVPWD
nr:Alstrom syndrome protein 1 [Microcebus murinus]